MVERYRGGTATQDVAELAKLKAKKGQSLWKDAWRRLRKNKAAMLGLVVTILVSLTAILADVLIPMQPDYGQPWLRANPPGFQHPAALAENRFDVGEDVVIPNGIPDRIEEILSSDGTIVYTATDFVETEYSVKVRRGKVARKGIQLQAGAVKVDELQVRGELEYFQLLDDDGKPGKKYYNISLKPRQKLPPELEGEGPVMIVRVRQPRTAEPERIEVVIKGGKCASITRGDKKPESLRLDGRFVSAVHKDGEEAILKHWWGTDTQGRDVFSRVVYGGRISLMVGAVATLVSVLVGVIYGAVAGYLAGKAMSRWALVGALTGFVVAGLVYSFVDAMGAPWLLSLALALASFGGWVLLFTRTTGKLPSVFRKTATTVGEFMMRVVDIAYALPFMFLVILLMISYGQDIFTLFVALGLVQWLTMARIVRGQTLSLKEKEFIEAARMCGASHMSILFRHLIPNTLGVVVVYSTLMIPAVILQESFLAFIGLTVEFNGRTLDSWGSLIDLGRKALTSSGGNWWVLLFPSIAMAITLFSMNFLGDGLRDALDPQQKGRT